MNMNILQNRIDSFNKGTQPWPHAKAFPTIESFAKAGFYFVRRRRNSDNVRCFLCDVELSNWDPGHSPTARHKKASFYCPWVLLEFPDDETYQENTESSPKEDRMRAARKATFTHNQSWPPKKETKKDLHAPYTLAEAGFFYSPTLEIDTRIKCACCQVTINEPKRELNCKQIHRELKKECSFFFNKSGKGSTPNSQSSQTAEQNIHPPKTKAVKRTLSQGESASRKLTTAQQRKKIMDIKPVVSSYSSLNKNNITFGKTKKRILPSAKGQVITTDIFADLSTLKNNRTQTPSQRLAVDAEIVEKEDLNLIIPKKATSPASSPDIPHNTPSPLIPDLMDTIYPEGFLDDLPDVTEPRRTPSPQVVHHHESPHSPLMCFSPPLQEALREIGFNQSTPNHRSQGANVFDIFGESPFSPIRKIHQEQDTPVMERVRHRVVHDALLHLNKKKRVPPPLDASILVPETHVSEEVKSLPVEDYLERMFGHHVEKVEGHGLESIQTLQSSSDTIKQHLGSQLKE